MNDIEQQIKQVAENIITNEQVSVQTKRAVLAKINQFYEAFGYTADSAYISELESNIESRQPVIDATVNASMDVISSPEEYVRNSSKITSETVRMNLLDVMLDIDADTTISESVKQSLVTALIALYENAGLSLESQNKLAEALVAHASAVNQLEGLTDADITALFNLIANILGLARSNEQVENMSQFADVILAQAVLGGAQVVKILNSTPIHLADSPDALGSASANGSIILDRNLLGQTDVLDIVLMEQVLAIQNQITDSVQDQTLLSLLLLDYMNNVYGAAQLDRLADDFEVVMMQNTNLPLGRVQDFVDMINLFKSQDGKPEQQIQAALEFVIKQSMREQGLTTLDIIKQDNALKSQVAQLLPIVAQLHANTDLTNNVIPQLQDNKLVLSYDTERGAGIAPQQQSKIDGLEIVIPADLQDQINSSSIQTIIYDAATNQVRVVVADELTGEQTLFVFDTTTSKISFPNSF